MDDIFTINNKRKFTPFLELLNSQHETFKFTLEMEKDGKIQFLDTMVNRNGTALDVNVYRKPSSTARHITSDSHHDRQHKVAAYHSMAHFMVNLPLSRVNAEAETEKIIQIGKTNGFERKTIQSIINKHKKEKERKELSTLYEQNKEPLKRCGIKFIPEVTQRLKPIFRKHELELVHRNEGSLKHLLSTAKDKLPKLSRFGVYKITCDNCPAEYLGTTNRNPEVRAGEHFKSKNWKNKTAVGKHLFENPEHVSEIKNVSLVREVQQPWKAECYEAIHIHKNKHKSLLKEDSGNIKSSLLKLFTREPQ